MADNFSFKDAAGATRTGKSDQVGGADIPYVKILDGTDGEVTPLAISAEGALVRPGAPMRYATEATSMVTADATWTGLVSANATRRALTLWNSHASRIVYVSFGAPAVVPANTVTKFALYPGAVYEMPSDAIYTGIISMSSPTGAVSVFVGEAS